MFNRVINSFFVVALLFVVQAPATIYGQRETRDRPDTIGPRSVGGKDRAESRRDRKADVDPEAKIDEQLRSTARTANVNKMRRESLTTAGTATEDAYATAIAQARLDYGTNFAEDLQDPTFRNSHTRIPIDSFAMAYIIAVNPIVNRKLGGYQLAVLRSMVTTYDDYIDILREKVPELGKEEAKAVINNAEKVAKAALSKK